jgi:hypothetical protein
MFFTNSLPFINDYIDELDNAIKEHASRQHLTSIQKAWLKFCLMGILLTNTVNWKAFERASLGEYKINALSWMFRHSKLPWDLFLTISIQLILHRYGIKEGVLVVDDSDHQRAKFTKSIFKSHKVYDKKTGGYFNGQSLVFLLLATSKITIPVGFCFHQPDPDYIKWCKEDKKLIKLGVKKAQRPKAPAPNEKYPSKSNQALKLIEKFRASFPNFIVKAVVVDGLFATQEFMDNASALCNNTQVISRLHSNQKVMFRNKEWSLDKYFKVYGGVPKSIKIRGGKEVDVLISSARLHVCAHGKKRFVIALKYPNEDEYRFLVATDMSWRTEDIVHCHTLRWLVEVFFEDWKLYEGWGQLAKHTGEDGSCRGVTLSLLLDHALLLHPKQQANIENNLPAYTVGSLQKLCQGEALLLSFQDLLSAENVAEGLQSLADRISRWIPLLSSGKHMNGRDLGRQEPTPSLCGRA